MRERISQAAQTCVLPYPLRIRFRREIVLPIVSGEGLAVSLAAA
jgi:hypothetical protein